MKQKVSFRLVATGNAVNIDIGFIPDEIFAIRDLDGGTNEIYYRWLRVLADAENDGQWGFNNIQDGTKAANSDADNGFIPYLGSKIPRVRLPAPNGNGESIGLVTGDWTGARSSAATARSVTALGTILRPTTHNGYVYECITAGTTSGTEPTWGTEVGGSTFDSDVEYICRLEDIVNEGGLGFTLGATISTDGEEWAFTAEQHDRYDDMGDADGQDPVSFR